eukprot:765805-Hanusia_phi.AAC.1
MTWKPGFLHRKTQSEHFSTAVPTQQQGLRTLPAIADPLSYLSGGLLPWVALMRHGCKSLFGCLARE